MKASPIKLLSLLGDNKTVFKIPVYQRNYEWRLEQVDQYFRDIERIASKKGKKTHFLGTIVYVEKELEGLMYEKILIDGQQRITTSILLLKAIIDLAQEREDTNINIEEIYETYLVNKHASEKSRLRLKPVEADMQAFEELMMGNKTESRIYRNYKYLKDELENSEYSITSIYQAMMQLNIVYISLGMDENPQVIFESLNSTGLSLTEADLIRNFILMGLEYEYQTKLYKQYWMKIEELLTNAIISDFVRDYLTMKEARVPNKNKVYEAFKSYYFTNNYDSEDILSELLVFARYYDSILKANTEIFEVNKYLDSINQIRSTVTYPFILFIFDEYYRNENISKDEFSQILEIIVSYIYRRNICNIGTNALNGIFAVLPREVIKSSNNSYTYVEAVVDYLMSRTGTGIFPRNNEFRNNFLNQNIYDKSHNIAKKILYSIEENLHKEIVNPENLTIEHILPQKLTPEWDIELGINAFEKHNLYCNTIGNLTLTKYNSEISNKSFRDKKEYYKNSNVKITRDIAKYEKWTEDSILDRAEFLYELAIEIWKLPEDNYQNIAKERLIPNETYSILDNIIVTGYIPKAVIIDTERISAKTWKNMLVKTCRYLFDLDEELFKSLLDKSNFRNMISYEKEDLRNPELIKDGIYIQTQYSSKDILNYIVLFTREYSIEDLVYFEIS